MEQIKLEELRTLFPEKNIPDNANIAETIQKLLLLRDSRSNILVVFSFLDIMSFIFQTPRNFRTSFFSMFSKEDYSDANELRRQISIANDLATVFANKIKGIQLTPNEEAIFQKAIKFFFSQFSLKLSVDQVLDMVKKTNHENCLENEENFRSLCQQLVSQSNV